MTTAAGQPAVDLREPAGWRRTKNQIATIAMWTAFFLTLIPLGFVLYTVIAKGASAINWQFLTGGPIPPNVVPAGIGGMGPAVVGTLLITGLAAVMAVPLGVLGAIYVNEYGGRGPLARVVRFMADVMTGVPSIVMGLFIFSIWVLHFGYSGLAGALALGCLMLPIVTSLSREVIATVPTIDKEGAYALGATRLEMIRGAVWPHSQGGIVGAVMLGLGRAMGETIAAALVIGSSPVITSHLFAPVYNMPSVIANEFGEATGVFRAALMGLGVLLFAFTIIINVIARAVVERSARRQRGA